MAGEKDYLPYTYLMSEFVDMWTQSHDGGRRFGAITTNISKCFNVLKGAQCLPIATMVKFTWSKLVAYFHNQHKGITYDLLGGKRWSTYAMSTWLENRWKFEKHHVRAFSNEHAINQVVTSGNKCSTGRGNHIYEIRLYELFFLAYVFFCCLLLFIVGYMFSKIKVKHWRRQLYIEKKVAH